MSKDIILVNANIARRTKDNFFVATNTFGDANSYLQISNQGKLGLTGNATAWEDLRFPATQLRQGALSKPDFDYTNVGLLFDPATTETIYAIAQMPHTWKLGSTIKPHIHWSPTSTDTGNVYWRLEYKWTNINATESGTWTTLNIQDAADGTVGKHQIIGLGDMDGTGKTLSSAITMKLSRIGGDTLDTYTDDARLLEFDIHYEIDAFGSDEEYVK